MIDAEKLLDRLLGELPKPDGSPESLNAYLDAVERIVKVIKMLEEPLRPASAPVPRHPLEDMLGVPENPLRRPWDPNKMPLRPRATFSTGPFPRETWGSTTHDEDDGA